MTTVEKPFEVHCANCGACVSRSYNSQKDAEDNAWEAQTGIRDQRLHNGDWLCLNCYETAFEKMVNPRGDYCLTEAWAEDNGYSRVAGVEVEIPKARKPHPCSRHRNCQIRPGQEYIRTTIAPWVMVADDVDEDGRTIGSRNGEWSVSRLHRYDDEANEDRKGECRWCRVLPGETHKADCPKREES